MADPRAPASWLNLDLRGDPILVVGWRPAPKSLKAAVVDLYIDTFDAMRDIARNTLTALSQGSGEPWHPNAHQELGEQYLTVDVADLPPRPRAGRQLQQAGPAEDGQIPQVDHQLGEAAAMLELVLAPGKLDSTNPADLMGLNPLFYAIAWEHADAGHPAAFVSKYDPTYVLRKAYRFFRFEGTLRSAPAPALALDDRADMVITQSEIAVLRASSFDGLFSDIRALLNDVPENIEELEKALTNLPFDPGTRQILSKACMSHPSFARRLQNLAVRAGLALVTPKAFSSALKSHGKDPRNFLAKGKLVLPAGQVGTFLDIVEGRWYEADFTGESRRAGSWSRRK